MIPNFRAWGKEADTMHDVTSIWFDRNNEQYKLGHVSFPSQETVDTIFDNFELMQSTGLKDKNGVEIFEGDIVVGQQHLTTDSSTPFEIKGLVRYSKRNTMFYLDEKSFGHDKFMHSLGSSIYQYEVIGNIYENPELLEAIE